MVNSSEALQVWETWKVDGKWFPNYRTKSKPCSLGGHRHFHGFIPLFWWMIPKSGWWKLIIFIPDLSPEISDIIFFLTQLDFSIWIPGRCFKFNSSKTGINILILQSTIILCFFELNYILSGCSYEIPDHHHGVLSFRISIQSSSKTSSLKYSVSSSTQWSHP